MTIVQHQFQYVHDFQNSKDEDYITGITSGNRHIIFVNCHFVESGFFKLKAHFSIQAYILASCETVDPLKLFHKISFSSPATTNFYSPQQAILPSQFDYESWNGVISVESKPFEDTNIEFKLNDVNCQFNVSRLRNHVWNKTNILDCVPYFQFVFPEYKGINTIIEYYLKLLRFLVFANYSRSIPFDDIKIFIKRDTGFEKIGIVHIFSDNTIYEGTDKSTLTIYDLIKDELKNIFTLITPEQNDKDIRDYYIPQNNRDRNWGDHAKWLSCASCFEGIFKKYNPNFKANRKGAFATAKDGVLNVLNEFRANSQNISTKKELSYIDDFIKQVEQYDGFLEELFRIAFDEHTDIIYDINERIKNKIPRSSSKQLDVVY